MMITKQHILTDIPEVLTEVLPGTPFPQFQGGGFSECRTEPPGIRSQSARVRSCAPAGPFTDLRLNFVPYGGRKPAIGLLSMSESEPGGRVFSSIFSPAETGFGWPAQLLYQSPSRQYLRLEKHLLLSGRWKLPIFPVRACIDTKRDCLCVTDCCHLSRLDCKGNRALPTFALASLKKQRCLSRFAALALTSCPWQFNS